MLNMDILSNIVIFILSVIFLYKGSDILVIGTSKTALKLGVSSLVISLTVVAYGTSAPELAASTIASLQSHPNFSLGNVLGSCLANLLLVLGVSAIIRPLSVRMTIIKRELPILLIATVLLLSLSTMETLNAFVGIIFLASFAAYLIFFVQTARRERENNLSNMDKNNGKIWKYVAFIIIGIIGVVAGAHLLVESAVFFAHLLGISEFVIAISLVAVGTSLPELAVSATASVKKESDISIGNLLGSNVFNILLILGICSIIHPIPIDDRSFFSMIFLLVVTMALFPILYTGKRISRVEGLILVSAYIIYMLLIFL